MASHQIHFLLTSSMTKDEVMAELADVPGHAVISASVSKGDRPWESDSVSLSAFWSADASSSSSSLPKLGGGLDNARP